MSFFISFEGPEGSGKSTQASLLTDYLRDRGYTVRKTREPGGTPIGEKIRNILLNPENDEMEALTELFLYEAGRHQHVKETILPALERGEVVISDRFADASTVYQGVSRTVGLDTVKKLNQLATDGLQPDLTIILDVPTDRGLKKARQESENKNDTIDRIERENRSFHETVREAYHDLAEKNPDRCYLIERNGSIEEIQDRIRELCNERLITNAN